MAAKFPPLDIRVVTLNDDTAVVGYWYANGDAIRLRGRAVIAYADTVLDCWAEKPPTADVELGPYVERELRWCMVRDCVRLPVTDWLVSLIGQDRATCG